jgi:hypothetical protein
MAQKKAVSAKKKSARKKIKLTANLGRWPAKGAQVARLRKALENEVLTWVNLDAPGETPPLIVCEEFRKAPRGPGV